MLLILITGIVQHVVNINYRYCASHRTDNTGNAQSAVDARYVNTSERKSLQKI